MGPTNTLNAAFTFSPHAALMGVHGVLGSDVLPTFRRRFADRANQGKRLH